MSLLKRTLLWILFVGTLAGTIVAQRPANHAERFNPSGEYHPLDRATDYLDLQFHLKVRYQRGSLVAWGDVYGSGSRFYKFRSVSVTKKHLRFSTRSLAGVRYSFDGTFLCGGSFAMQDPPAGSFPLQGTLRKYVKGKEVMELKTSFVYYVGC